jgi:outer membrane lipoprotein-sorting protein
MILPLLLALAAGPAGDPAAELARVSRELRDGKAHEAEFQQTYTPRGFTHANRESGTVVVQAPGNLRFQYGGPSGKVFTFDGETARFYTPAERQMVVRPLSEEDRAQLPLVFLESPSDLERSYTLALESSGETRTVLLTPKAAGGEIAWVRLTLSASGTPVRLSFETAGGDRTEFQFRNFHAAPARRPEDFSIRPPAGTRIVEND